MPVTAPPATMISPATIRSDRRRDGGIPTITYPSMRRGTLATRHHPTYRNEDAPFMRGFSPPLTGTPPQRTDARDHLQVPPPNIAAGVDAGKLLM